jgi:hypothetical protein
VSVVCECGVSVVCECGVSVVCECGVFVGESVWGNRSMEV